MVDAVFTVTGNLRLYHAKQSWLSTDVFRIIHNGVNTEKFSPRPETSAKIRAELKIPENRVVVGSVGRLVPIKDHGTLLRAAELLVREGKNVHVLIVGAGPELERLRAFVTASVDLADRVTFGGASDRVPELLNAMDLFVLPSICEGMSNTILEAMACGLPVIATRVGGNPELGEEGRSACFFAPRDFQSLARIIAGLVDDRGIRRMLGNAGRQHALEEFSLASMVRQYRDLYLELVTKRNRKEA
jgi:glycosyltransferase involved in cell wall biosynthesis